ncbi:MAG: helix-hairpin-helix domain-containing protein [Candidatus Omnitrophica bacterium]|nr:hypothetical protein [bacterium]NUN95692.1 helix-hairpin-helix domain-containing protein [Candidatus Omnitrophota bacterium]
MNPETEKVPETLSPDPPPEMPRRSIDPVEAALIAILLVVIFVGNVLPRLLPEMETRSISVRRGSQSGGLPPIDWLATPIPLQAHPQDLNTISRSDLIGLPGIGPTLADQILAYRSRHGKFESIEELDQVSGIGPKKLETLREFLFVAGPTREPTSQAALSKSLSPTAASHEKRDEGSRVEGGRKIHLNTASLSEIDQIPGIGETFARRILERREALGRFSSWEQVGEVPGIGEKRLENMKRHATID